jgi:methylated-DNA-[protein]-cysteine S-methyltransferase
MAPDRVFTTLPSMSELGFALFETAIGNCGVAWGPGGLVGVWLPESDPGRTRARLLRRYPGAVESQPPTQVQDAIRSMTALLAGEAADLSDIVLDTSGQPPFFRRVFDLARAIPPGRTATYGELARQLGDPGAARAVGEAMGKNPFPIVVPCHRVLAAGGKTGGFSAPGGTATKLRILEIEGALAPETLPLFGR